MVLSAAELRVRGAVAFEGRPYIEDRWPEEGPLFPTETGIAGDFPNLVSSFYVAQCNHCDRPSCVEPCPSGATFQAEDGVVKVDRDLCIGCVYCVEACPYGARYINPVTKIVDKCDFCASRLARGLEPACVATRTAHAKFFGDLEDRPSGVFRMVYEQRARRLETARVTIGPNVYCLGKKEPVDLVVATFPPRLVITPSPNPSQGARLATLSGAAYAAQRENSRAPTTCMRQAPALDFRPEPQ